MHKVLVLKTGNLPEDAEVMDEFNRLGNSKVSYQLSRYRDIEITIKNGRTDILIGETPLTEYDFVFFKSWRKAQNLAIALAHFLRQQGIKFIDTALLLPLHGDKLLQYVLLAENNLPVPNTIYAHKDLIANRLPVYIEKLGLPVIIKDAGASKGESNFLANSLDQATEYIQKFGKDAVILLQEFIPNEFDYRLFVVGDEVGLSFKRVRKEGTHLNNTSAGASSEELVSPPANLEEIAVKSSQVFAREIAGVDIVISTKSNKPYILEVNPSPGIVTKNNKSLTNKKIALIDSYINKRLT